MAIGTRTLRTASIVSYVVICAAFAMLCSGCARNGTDTPAAQTQQPTAGSAQTSNTPQDEGLTASSRPPVWPTPEAIQATLEPWLAQGAVTVDWDHSTDEERRYVLPPGSFGDDDPDGPVIRVWAYRYADDRRFVRGVYDVDREYGGSTPEEVYASVVVAIRDVGAANDWGDGLREYPEVAGGMVTDEWSEVTVAGTKDYWYQASISGVRGDAAFNDALVGLGRLLAE